VHCHNLNDIISHYRLKQNCKPKPVFLVQDHGSVYKPYFRLARPFFRKIDLVIFNSPGQEAEWVKNRVFPREKVSFLPEGSSRFADGTSEEESITKTHPKGPKILWVGNLDRNKDPFTILRGIKKIIPDYPDLQLGMIFRKAALENQVREYILENRLESNIELIGGVPFEKMPEYYRRFDYFILGSKKEGSGYAAIEAISLGLVPVLSNIPSFSHISGNGRAGILFEQGNDLDLSVKLREILQKKLAFEKAKAREHFLQEWSPEAMVRKYVKVYEGIVRLKE
jgi:glycosyltransferase involved in cell wall biosynthesis